MMALNLPRQRRECVRGEVRCLACAGLIGRLPGSRDNAGARLNPFESLESIAYRSAEANSEVVACRPGMRPCCATCGGAGALDELETVSTYQEAPCAFEDAEPPRHGPGLPRQAFRTLDKARSAPELMLLTSQS
jgi:hypothetical protein